MTSRAAAFMAVGAGGFMVQIGVLLLLTAVCGWPYPLATIAAVEAAVLHNFFWHERWTWGDRRQASVAQRLLRFNASTGLTSIAGNVVLTTAAVELLHCPTLIANAAAVALTSLANFVVADRWVFVDSVREPASSVGGDDPGCARVRLASSGTLRLSLMACVLAFPALATAAEPRQDTLAAWNSHVREIDSSLPAHLDDAPVREPVGRTVSVPGGIVHEWRGSTVIPHVTVAELVQALETPGLPPPAADILEARVLSRSDDALRVYMRLTRTAIITVTYDTEHEVRFARRSPSFATSRSVATRIREVGGSDRGFLWRLNSYWRYRQVGADVVVDVLSVTLSRDIPVLAKPIAGPIVNRIARESMERTLEAVRRFGINLRPQTTQN
jgi:putative flippase GtrA